MIRSNIIQIYSFYFILMIMMPRGRPSAPIQIVPPSELLAADQLNSLVNFSDLLRDINDDPVAFCAKFKLLMNEYTCPHCQQACSLINRSDVIDGKQWYCKICKRRRSIRMNSFFERSHLSIQQILTIVYGFSRNWEQKDIAFEAKVRYKVLQNTTEIFHKIYFLSLDK